jgi:hypothetical protein
MVESMEHSQDVERLFSWLKAPMVHYREFAPQVEVAEAVATWPVVHKTAVQTGVAPDTEPAPHGDAAVRERQARDRRFMPPAAARAIHDSPMPGTEAPHPTAGRLADVPAGEAPASAGQSAVAADQTDLSGRAPPSRGPVEPEMAGFDEPAAAAHPENRRPPARPPASGDRRGLFSGEYREGEGELRPAGRGADRQDRSLEAVFSRLSGGGHDRLPDPRERARTTPGLGPVFGRLR